MKSGKALFRGLLISWLCFILSFSVALPLVWRGFYYMQIEPLQLEDYGYTREEIIEAFDDMMDYCIFGGVFKTGKLRWSESEKAHFDDVSVLFKIDFTVLAVSTVSLIVLYVIRKKRNLYYLYYNHQPSYWAGWLELLLFTFIGIVGSIDFDITFVIFHRIFFPGKTNWYFDWNRDEIIRILPQKYFSNCALLIVGSLLVICVILIVTDRVGKEEE